MRLILQKPQWDHTVTGRKRRASGKFRGAPDQTRSWERLSDRANAPAGLGSPANNTGATGGPGAKFRGSIFLRGGARNLLPPVVGVPADGTFSDQKGEFPSQPYPEPGSADVQPPI